MNTATVTGTYAPTGQVGRATDVAYSHAVFVDLRIENAVNAADPVHPTSAEDADTAPGRYFALGTSLVWTYLVTNRGTDPVMLSRVYDDHGTPADLSDDFDAVPIVGAGQLQRGRHEQGRLARPG